MNDYSIGEYIRAQRKKCGISQEQLALKADITPAYLGQIERGERNPTVKIVERIAAVLNISMATFFGELKAGLPKHSKENSIETESDNLDSQILFELKKLSIDQKKEICKIIKSIIKLAND